MRRLALLLFLFAFLQNVSAQYYLRGELKDEKGNGIAGARIALYSKGTYPYYTGSSGAFGIPTNLKVDTITFSLDGFDTLKLPVITNQYGTFTLKATNRKAFSSSFQLSSVTKNLRTENNPVNTIDGETYTSTIENPFVTTKNFPETAFSIHVDRASYSNVRRFITQKEKPPVDAVRIEEMLNYFNFKTKQNTDQHKTFSINTNVTSCGWNTQNQLLFINLQAKKIDAEKIPPANLVFLIDVSGSMDMPNRLTLVKSAFKLLTENLRAKDLVSIVTYGDAVTELLPATPGTEKQKIIEAIEGLRPKGATAGASAIRTAYRLAKTNFIVNGNNRVILATDGDFNIGQTSEKDLEELIVQQSKGGVYLTCLGVGMGNYKDSKLEILAKKGHGNFAYLDNEQEAEKVLVEEFTQTLYTVANNVYLNAVFNPALVKQYRLIGFDNKRTAMVDTTAAIEGGEVGSGHCLMAVFEIVPNVPVASTIADTSLTLATLFLSYRNTGNNELVKEKYDAHNNFAPIDKADSCLRFATAVIMFGGLLKQSAFVTNTTWDFLHNYATSTANKNDLLQAELVELISKAKKMYPKTNKKNRQD